MDAPIIQVHDHYNYFTDQALRACEGRIQEADYMLDCSIYEFYYRLRTRNRYTEWHNAQVKAAMNRPAGGTEA